MFSVKAFIRLVPIAPESTWVTGVNKSISRYTWVRLAFLPLLITPRLRLWVDETENQFFNSTQHDIGILTRFIVSHLGYDPHLLTPYLYKLFKSVKSFHTDVSEDGSVYHVLGFYTEYGEYVPLTKVSFYSVETLDQVVDFVAYHIQLNCVWLDLHDSRTKKLHCSAVYKLLDCL